MIELEYPPLPPLYEYRKLGEKKDAGENMFIYPERDVDIYWKEEYIPQTIKTSSYNKKLRAYVNTQESIGYLRLHLKDTFSQQFATPQEALNVIVARLWLGEEG